MTSRVAQRDVERLASTYLSFLWDAFDQETKRFRNFMSHSREWLEEVRFGGQSRASALGCGNGAWAIEKRWSSQSLRALISTRFAGCRAVHFSARLGFVLLAMQEYLRSFLRRPDGESAA
jgi:hypothetical protein